MIERVTADGIASATEHQPRVRATLTAALAAGPTHAYLFRGPRGAGKRAAARAFAAELLASGSDDPDDTRRRAMIDPSPHPDLVWLAPIGSQHLVDEVREQVIRQSVMRPYEGSKRVFVIESADAMRDESQNALLKTLEEPPSFDHMILISSGDGAILETIASRCQPVDFSPSPAGVIAAELPPGMDQESRIATARLSSGDLERARFLAGERGSALRRDAENAVTAALEGELGRSPWTGMLERAEAVGEASEERSLEDLEAGVAAGLKMPKKEIGDQARRAGRRARTRTLDLGLELCAAWLRDLVAVGVDAEPVVFNRDRLPQLRDGAAKTLPARARAAAELVQETRRTLGLNVSEELALESLFFRLERTLGGVTV